MIVASYELFQFGLETEVVRTYAQLVRFLENGWYEFNIVRQEVWRRPNDNEPYIQLSVRTNTSPLFKMRIYRKYSLYSTTHCPGVANTGSWFKCIKDGGTIYREITGTAAQELGLA